MIFVIIKDIFWKVCLVGAILIILLSIWKLAVASEHQKVFDLNNWEDRFAIILEVSPPGVIGLQPVPEEFRPMAVAACIKRSIMSGSTSMFLAAAGGYVVHKVPGKNPQGEFQVICMSSIEDLGAGDNLGWKEICTLFNMTYTNNPTRESVLCEKAAPIQKYT